MDTQSEIQIFGETSDDNDDRLSKIAGYSVRCNASCISSFNWFNDANGRKSLLRFNGQTIMRP